MISILGETESCRRRWFQTGFLVREITPPLATDKVGATRGIYRANCLLPGSWPENPRLVTVCQLNYLARADTSAPSSVYFSFATFAHDITTIPLCTIGFPISLGLALL